MRREKQLTKRLRTLHTLAEAVTAMKSLSAHHFLVARRSLPAARDYRDAIDQVIDQLNLEPPIISGKPRGVLLLTSDLGLCGDYNSRLAGQIDDFLDPHDRVRVYIVGRRGRQILQKHGVSVDRDYSAPASVDGLPERLLQIAEDVIGDYSRGEIGSLEVVSARFTGAGKFSRERTRVLPIRPAVSQAGRSSYQRQAWQRYQSQEHLLAAAVREYLYITLYELLLDTLASEHGMRLVAAESARQWIEETAQTVQRQLAAIRRENSTQEVLDIVSAARSKRRD